MRFLLLAVFGLLFSILAYGQNPDSLNHSIDSSAKAIQQSYEDLQDSLEQLKLNRTLTETGKPMDEFLEDYRQKQLAEKRRTYLRIGVGIAFLAALFYGIARKSSKQKRTLN